MNKFGCNLLALCMIFGGTSVLANEENTSHLNDRLEAAKTDAKRFKSALLRAQKSNREQVEKLTSELNLATSKTSELEKEIEGMRKESLSRVQTLKQELERIQHKSANLQVELSSAKQHSHEQIAELTAQLTSSRLEAGKVKDELLAARKGNTTQIDSLEIELKNAHTKMNGLKNELAEAKTLNAKQLKNFTAWLYNAKNDAEGLKRQISEEQNKFSDQVNQLQAQLSLANQEKSDLMLDLARAKENHQDQLLTMQEQIIIAQAQHEQMRENFQNERSLQYSSNNQNQMSYPESMQACCCPQPLPPIVCYRPNVEESTSWIRGEILVWTAEAGTLDFVIPNFPVSSTPLGQTGEVEEAKFGWDPGFRVEVGHRFRPDFWELALQYTYINIDGTDSFSRPSDPTRVLMPTKDNVSTQATDSARSKVDLFYNVFDLMLARSFLPTKQLIVRPTMGLTGTWMDREMDVKYNGVGSPSNETHNRDKWEFHGGGMRVGIDLDWYIGSGFSLFGKSSLAALIGYYKNTFEADTNNAGSNLPPATIENAKYDDQRIATHLQMQMGPQWGKMWNDVGILIFAGYEVNAWFNVEEMRYSNPTNTTSTITPRHTVINTSTLGMQGFVGKIQLNF